MDRYCKVLQRKVLPIGKGTIGARCYRLSIVRTAHRCAVAGMCSHRWEGKRIGTAYRACIGMCGIAPGHC